MVISTAAQMAVVMGNWTERLMAGMMVASKVDPWVSLEVVRWVVLRDGLWVVLSVLYSVELWAG